MADNETDTTVDETDTETTDTSTETENDDTVTLTKAEVDALRRQAAEGQKAARRAKTDAERREQEKAKAEGKWEELAKDNERKAAEAEAKLLERDRTDRVTSAARRLKFKSPEVAIKFLDENDLDDDQLTEQALKKVLTEYPELKVPEQRRSGTSIRSDDDTEVEKDPMVGIAKDLHAHLSGGL